MKRKGRTFQISLGNSHKLSLHLFPPYLNRFLGGTWLGPWLKALGQWALLLPCSENMPLIWVCWWELH